MTTETQTVRTAGDHVVVLHVTDAINPRLAGRDGVEYRTPPLPRREALMLVALLLGRGEDGATGANRWSCPIAGGRRTIILGVPER